MSKKQGKVNGQLKNQNLSEDLRSFSRQLLQVANSGLTRTYFLREVVRLIIDFYKAEMVRILFRSYDDPSRYEIIQFDRKTFKYSFFPQVTNNTSVNAASSLDEHWKYILFEFPDKSLSFVTKRGSLYIRDPEHQTASQEFQRHFSIPAYFKNEDIKTLLVIPFLLENERIGLMELKNLDKEYLSDFNIDLIETFVQTLGITLLNQHTQAALQERVKELTCLYRMSQIAEEPYVSLKDLMHEIMVLLPPAWQYPDITQTRIILDGIDYYTPNNKQAQSILSADINIENNKRGVIEIMYTEERPELDEGPFLKEERKLIDTIAKELALIVKRRESEEDKEKLLNQLHHADRLATVGELVAGVAHEINEPLGSILGFAQLASKHPGLPDQVKSDLEKIINSSLNAREIIKRLISFSKQVSVEKKQVNLNQIIEDSLDFFISRCNKDGIGLNLSLDQDIPEITADPVQINQVVVNIIVNAIQAMPGGGELLIKTWLSGNEVVLSIKDTGMGMAEDLLERIFDPFFSTKSAGTGLGLGLSIARGIIDTHHGSIEALSEPGKGTEFIIRLPVV